MKNRAGIDYTPWKTSNGSEYTPSEDVHGFVYIVDDFANGLSYVGKKQVYTKAKRGQKKHFTDWRTYKTSCEELKKEILRLGVTSNDLKFTVIWECADETVLKFTELEEVIRKRTFLNGYNSGVSIRQICKIKDIEERRTEC